MKPKFLVILFSNELNYSMQKLTNAEEEVMHYLLQFKESLVRDIIDAMPEPKPAYNIVSTIICMLRFAPKRQLMRLLPF